MTIRWRVAVLLDSGELDIRINGLYTAPKALERIIELIEEGFSDNLYVEEVQL